MKTISILALKGLLSAVLLCASMLFALDTRASTQTIAAGTSQTNLPTESRWPGAQNPPYICCWASQGQYVTFAFNTGATTATFALRYSAGSGLATRKILLDGVVLAANQIFPATSSWSNWATIQLNAPVSGGAHTLTVIFDSASGSSRYINLDNLTIAEVSNSQTIAAGTSQTNLPTESRWPGAQNPPYVCCWISQGQFVTFVFNASAGTVTFALRYSAGSGLATRKILLDNVVLKANQNFPATSNWSTWATVQLNSSVSGGAHTLTVIFDSASGSSRYINLDNLTVNGNGVATSIAVALGYADSVSGLTPWAGSPHTLFIGEPAQCCATHGPDNGSPGYEAGAIEITNTSSTTVTLNSVSVDFGGASSPSHFDLWSGGTGKLPQTVAPGSHVVLTMTSSFNFDTSDLFGEACHLNTGVVPVVHVTVNGVTIDYDDDHQILNSDGADLASCPGDISEQTLFTPVSAGSQPAAAPINDVTPSLTGVATQGHVLSGFAGAWNASPPPMLALQWMRCDSAGGNCVAISGATSPTYRPTASDVGSTLRLRVTASNAKGTSAQSSVQTLAVKSGAPVAQLGNVSTGFTSKYIHTTTEVASIFTATAAGTTIDFTFFARGAGGDQTFTPRIYSVVNGQKGTLLGTGTAKLVPKGTDGQWYISSLSGVHLVAGTQYALALASSGGSTYVGSESDGRMSFFVDYAP